MSTDVTPEPAIRCRDECGRSVVDDAAAVQAAWSWLDMTRTWRCPACWRALNEAGQIVGTAGASSDELDPTSRGALRKETASTIAAPTVKP